MKQNFNYYMPVNIVFGEGKLQKVGSLTKEMGKKAFLVTGRKSMRQLGITDRVVKLLEDNLVKVILYDRIFSNPTVEVVDEGAKRAAKEGCDVIIGLGGGSALDSAKGIAVVAAHGGSLWDYIGEGKVTEKTLPIVAIPTTAGTGSETTPYSVFTNKENLRKDAINSPYTFPKIAIIDPTLMKSMSLQLTTDTGFDALAHAVEAYLSSNANPLSDILAMKAISFINGSLVEATKNGENLGARSNMALASSMAGMAIGQAGVVAGHGFGMSIGGILDTPHGRTVGILLPHIMSYNLPEVPERIAQLAGCFNLPTTGNIMEDARKVIETVKRIVKQVNFPTRLKDIGVDEKDIPRIVEDCIDRSDMANNPRKFGSKEARKFLESIA